MLFLKVLEFGFWNGVGTLCQWELNRSHPSEHVCLYCALYWFLLEQMMCSYLWLLVWRLRGNIIRTAPCCVVWHNVHSQQHTYVSSSYRFSRLGLSHWDPYAMRRGGCLELYYCNVVEWSWWDSSFIWKTNWFPSVLWPVHYYYLWLLV